MPLARFRQCVLLAAVTLGGCGLQETLPVHGIFEDSEFVGAVAADEPHAALAARDVLAAGGSAADAAAALTFTLAVTYPSVASLGGGGQCLVHAPGEDGDATETLDFLPARSSKPAMGGGHPSAVPGSVHGMYALHTRYGRLRWSQLFGAAERFAQFGYRASRALARDLAAGTHGLLRDSAARALFAGRDGQPIAEGQTVVQLDLGAVLSRLRIEGPGGFHSGRTARVLLEAVTQAGGTLGAEDLRRYRPRWRGTVSLPFGSHELHTTPSAGGIAAAAMWHLAGADGRYLGANGADRFHLLAEAGMRGFADRSTGVADGAALDVARLERSMKNYRADSHSAPESLSPPPPVWPQDAATSSFAVVDRRGMAVVCGLTMNALFGAGRLAPETGIILAKAPEPDRPFLFAPALLVNRVNQQVLVAAGAGGGAAAPSALAATLLELLNAERPLRSALAAPRVHHGDMLDRLAVEPAIDGEIRAALEARGHRIVEVPAIGRVNAIHCPGGLPRNPETCRFASDRRGFGIAVGGTR